MELVTDISLDDLADQIVSTLSNKDIMYLITSIDSVANDWDLTASIYGWVTVEFDEFRRARLAHE